MQRIVTCLIVLFLATISFTASAQMTKPCPANNGQDTDAALCDKMTQLAKEAAACAPTQPCATTPKPLPEIQCLKNPNDEGKIRKTGKYACTCDEEGYALVVDGKNWRGRRCVVVSRAAISDAYMTVEEACNNLSISEQECTRRRDVLAGIDPSKLVTKDDLDKALGPIKADLANLKTRVTTLEGHDANHETRITALENREEAKHPPFSVLPEVGGLGVYRPVSGTFFGAGGGLRLRYNAETSPWFFTVGAAGYFGSSQGNGESYVYQGQLGAGAYVNDARSLSLELGLSGQAHYANIISNLPGGITTNGRGSAVGGYAGLDLLLVGKLGVSVRGGLGSGVDNVVDPNPVSHAAGAPHKSKEDTELQPYGTLNLFYRFDF